MPESSSKNFNHLKIHTQYSICEGAIKIDDLQDFSKSNKIQSLALCDTSNLCGALEFAEKISKAGTQPIIGTQINFKYADTIGLLPLFALNEEGYKRIIKLSSLSYLENDELSDPHIILRNYLKITRVLLCFLELFLDFLVNFLIKENLVKYMTYIEKLNRIIMIGFI
jgi:DNA polymerase-3 subunit alpha